MILLHGRDARLVMDSYRTYILGCKRKFGTARSQVHHRDLIKAYLEAKREIVKAREL